MAVLTLVYGASGKGKTASLRTLPADDVALIAALDKPLPFPNKAWKRYVTRDMAKALAAARKTERKVIVFDDFGYDLTDLYMTRYQERDQFAVYKDMAAYVYGFVNELMSLSDDKTIYIVMHDDQDANHNRVPLTMGKLLTDKVNLLGMFTIALLAEVDGDEHVFYTNGVSGTKSPMGLFATNEIPNDLMAVDMAIRDYYGMTPLTSANTSNQ